MPAGLGYSFDPAAGQQQNGQSGQPGGFSRLSPQQAVKLLSLRIPERPGPSAIAPQALLKGQGAAGMPMNSIIQGMMQAFGQGSTPTPHVIPGYTGQNPQGPPPLENSSVPPNLDEILAQYQQMVPGGGFMGGTQQGQAYQGAGQGMGMAPQGPQTPAYLQQKQNKQDIQPLF